MEARSKLAIFLENVVACTREVFREASPVDHVVIRQMWRWLQNETTLGYMGELPGVVLTHLCTLQEVIPILSVILLEMVIRNLFLTLAEAISDTI